MKNRKLRYMSVSNRLFYVFNFIFWAFVLFVVVYPLYLICIASISDPTAVIMGKVTWRPVDISFTAYKIIIRNKELWTAYANSIYYTVAGVIVSIMVTMFAGYAVSYREFPGKKIISVFFMIPMFVSGGLIPTFLTVKNLGLYNTRAYLIIGGVTSLWYIMVVRTYIQNTIPEEMHEAAELDGATHFQYFFKVVMPLSKTIIATLAVYFGAGKWNDYMGGLIYIKDRDKLPLQTVLREMLASLQVNAAILGDFMTTDGMENLLAQALDVANAAKYCIIVVSTVPVVLLYFVLQKYFEQGVMIGSLKG